MTSNPLATIFSGLCLVLLLTLLAHQVPVTPNAIAQTGGASGDLIAVTGSAGSGIDVLWVIKKASDGEHLALYYPSQSGKALSLAGARKIKYDFALDKVNDVSPQSLRVDALRKLLLSGIKPSRPKGKTKGK